MNVSDWVLQRQVVPLAVVQGQTLAAVLKQVRAPHSPKITVVCERVLGDRLLAAAAATTARPTILVSRGLVCDLDQVAFKAYPWPTIFTAQVLQNYLDQETERLTAHAAVLSGYAPPSAMMARMVVERAGRILARAAHRMRGHVVVHDAGHALPREVCAGLTIFKYAAAPVPLTMDEELEPVEPPSLYTIAEHAEFLASTDTDVLRDLHAPFAGPEGKVLFDMWYRHLALLSATDDADDVSDAARATLAHQQRLLPPPRSSEFTDQSA